MLAARSQLCKKLAARIPKSTHCLIILITSSVFRNYARDFSTPVYSYNGSFNKSASISPSLQTGDGGVSPLLTELMAAALPGRIQADTD